MDTYDTNLIQENDQLGSRVIPSCFLRLWQSSNDLYALKNLNLRYVYANTPFLNLFADVRVIGSVASELYGEKLGAKFTELDRLVIAKKSRVTTVEAHQFGSGTQILQIDKYPLFSTTGEISGVIFHGRPALDMSASMIIDGLQPAPFRVNTPHPKFTEKEWEALFLLLLGRSRKDASEQLNVSIKTIDQRINNCLQKTLKSSTQELLNIAGKENWQRFIPKRFVSNNNVTH